MRYLWEAIHTILESYKGKEPLALFLKAFFRDHPKLGSRDRRVISEAVFCWYRAGKGFPAAAEEEKRVQAAILLCSTVEQAQMLLPEDWQAMVGKSFDGKLRFLAEEGMAFTLTDLFPYELPFSEGIEVADWDRALLQQPRLFLRLRVPVGEVKPLLLSAGIPYETPSPTTLSLPNGTDIKEVLPLEAYVVQDLSSQRVGEVFKPAPHEAWWDTCAGAGGKSIHLKDMEPRVAIIATDIRPAILQNLVTRFRRYKLSPPETHVLDAADAGKTKKVVGSRRFDDILCDVPCTGSGTWARTPEGAYFFDPESVKVYTARQRAILTNAVDYLKPDGRIVYATCSVFQAENEDVIEAVSHKKGLRIESSTLISGVEQQADSLFVAVLRRG
jgi:16S rRNA (cytosine967-C5)-methyltransferase